MVKSRSHTPPMIVRFYPTLPYNDRIRVITDMAVALSINTGMNYIKIYKTLISRGLQRTIIKTDYYEKHHIVPRCQGGNDEPTNIVWLYPEEHYLAHQLLVKMYPKDYGLTSAAIMMTSHPNGKRVNNKLYGWLRRKHSIEMSMKCGDKNSSFGTFWITDGIISKKVRTNTDIPIGWRKGRVILSMRKNTINTCKICDVVILKKKGRLCDEHFKQYRTEHGKRLYSNIRDSYKNRVFITDGVNDRLHPNDVPIPSGFLRGRSNNKKK